MKLPINYNNLQPAQRKIVREQYIKQQNGKCHHCGNPLHEQATNDIMKKRINKNLFPKNFFNWPIHLHHNHNTGMTIGAVHSHCNAVLWQYHKE